MKSIRNYRQPDTSNESERDFFASFSGDSLLKGVEIDKKNATILLKILENSHFELKVEIFTLKKEKEETVSKCSLFQEEIKSLNIEIEKIKGEKNLLKSEVGNLKESRKDLFIIAAISSIITGFGINLITGESAFRWVGYIVVVVAICVLVVQYRMTFKNE